MPGRIGTERINAEVVQGDEAFVEIVRPTVGTYRAILAKYGDVRKDELTPDQSVELAKEMCVAFVQRWNWVDWDGKPLPQLKDDPSVFDQLTLPEVNFLSGLFTVGDDAEERKKK